MKMLYTLMKLYWQARDSEEKRQVALLTKEFMEKEIQNETKIKND
ncbi:hypothetical protein [Thalassobacillus sp. CUG 92003]|nr:hypothetical protein [Thalassobacillus sp. CUG 92003]